MTVLVFHQLAILSKVEKAARVLQWSLGKNVLTGDNNVGKSTVVKSLYHALGADVPQMSNSLRLSLKRTANRIAALVVEIIVLKF